MSHPSLCNPGEVWVGNSKCLCAADLPNHLKPLKSIRFEQAYDIKGNRLSMDEYRGLVMSQADANRYNAIMEDRLSRIRAGEKL